MGALEDLAKGIIPIKSKGGNLADLASSRPAPKPQPIEIKKAEEPSLLTKAAAGFQEAIGGTGETLAKRVFGVGKKIAEKGAEVVAESRPAQAIASIQSGTPIKEALSHAFLGIGSVAYDEYTLSELGKRIGQKVATKEEVEKHLSNILSERARDIVLNSIGGEAPTTIKASIKTAQEIAEKGAKESAEKVSKTFIEKISPEIKTEIKKQYPLDLKDIPLKAKMGDVLEQARQRGYPYEGVEFGKPQLNEIKPTNLWEKPSEPTKITEVEKVSDVIEKPSTEAIGGIKQVPQEAIMGEKSSKMWERVSKDLPKEEQADLGYQGITLKEAADTAVKSIEEDAQRGYRIAMNLEKAPKGSTNTAFNIALAEKARQEGNHVLQAELVRKRTFEQIRRGQEIVSERTMTDNDPQKFLQQVISERLQKLRTATLSKKDLLMEKVSGKKIDIVEKTISKETEKARKMIDTKKLDLKAAQDFIDKLSCDY